MNSANKFKKYSRNCLLGPLNLLGPLKTLRNRDFFVIEKYVEGVKQDEKNVSDLLEAIMRFTDPVKEQLQPILSKLGQLRPKITKIRV